MLEEFYSNGKLLISGEYAVLDGAIALAYPTKFGQKLTVEPTTKPSLIWQSFDADDKKWFEAEFDSSNFKVTSTSDEAVSSRLQQILNAVRDQKPNFLQAKQGFLAQTTLTFPRNWGLGTSSTLINNIANWAEVDAFKLLQNTFGGSGYDIACAQNNSPIFYSLNKDKAVVEQIPFTPSFSANLYFVFLNQKQNSREAIKAYRKRDFDKMTLNSAITQISKSLVATNALEKFELLITQHEKLLSEVLGIAPVKERLFKDYFGAVKSLGAWGGDFVLATGNEKTPEYFKSKGFSTVLSFSEMLLIE